MYAIVGRLGKEHDAYRLNPYQIMDLIALELNTYVEQSDILHVPPNFIICLSNPQTQAAILAEPILQTNYFQLDMLPWCKEHELGPTTMDHR